MAQTGVSKSGRPDDAAGQPARGRELPDALVPDQRSVPAAEFLNQVAGDPLNRDASLQAGVGLSRRGAGSDQRHRLERRYNAAFADRRVIAVEVDPRAVYEGTFREPIVDSGTALLDRLVWVASTTLEELVVELHPERHAALATRLRDIIGNQRPRTARRRRGRQLSKKRAAVRWLQRRELAVSSPRNQSNLADE